MLIKYEQRAAAFMRATGINAGLADKSDNIVYGLRGRLGTDWRISFDFGDAGTMGVRYYCVIARSPHELVDQAEVVRCARSFAQAEGWQFDISNYGGQYAIEVEFSVKGRSTGPARQLGNLDDIIIEGLAREMPQRTLKIISKN